MTDTGYKHDYQIGDAVLATIGGAQIPGVVEDEQNGRLRVRLSQPWVDETGRQSTEAWLEPGDLSAYLEETGGTQALPS